jgi:shikimate kinase
MSLNGVNLYLVGVMGSGKMAVGDSVASRMGNYNFLETDATIEKATGLTIPEICEKEGEASLELGAFLRALCHECRQQTGRITSF